MKFMNLTPQSDGALAASITRHASRQTYTTIRFLVDRDRVDDALRAYAYFRWVDDWLDQEDRPRSQRLDFVRRQQALVAGELPAQNFTPEERLALVMLEREADPHSGLHVYVRNLMAVMAFDARRRGQLVSQSELEQYTLWLSTGVTEAMHYFIGHKCGAPCDETRYQAVRGAHITHMLRDTLEDVSAGYYNIPQEVLVSESLSPAQVHAPVYRNWVRQQVQTARTCFAIGREYLSRVECLRCRISAYAYIRRFEIVLDSIEREDYLLRPQYPERKTLARGLEMTGWALWMALKSRPAATSL
jgi:phytoene/squalene synthetase